LRWNVYERKTLADIRGEIGDDYAVDHLVGPRPRGVCACITVKRKLFAGGVEHLLQ
jgi:hypothetical protein